jgi:hypothetical protein
MWGMGFRPRFSLRMLFAMVAVAAVLVGWVAYQLNWIRQRHEFVNRFDNNTFYDIAHELPYDPPQCPWSIRLFGEQPREYIGVPKEFADRAKKLFPEATVLTH